MANGNYEAVLKLLLEAMQDCTQAGAKQKPCGIPVGVSNRHLHLSQADLDTLFGAGYQLTPIKDLSQPGQFACKETVTICGPKGAIEKIRVLGPVRSKTQVEILTGDGFKLGVSAPARLSGDLAGTPGITIIGPKGSVQIKEGLIVAQRHIHMTPQDAALYDVHDGQIVDIEIEGPRGGTYANVAVRANDASALECHVDTEEANAMSITSSTTIKIKK
ncbi:MAG: phosphate propanoyltransferase [Firmicutes bacterium]|nr:phosphate propanoyltransferase [Bacillota bacterium]